MNTVRQEVTIMGPPGHRKLSLTGRNSQPSSSEQTKGLSFHYYKQTKIKFVCKDKQRPSVMFDFHLSQ